ncbi:MAG: hypothetical protein RLP15_11215 [Cryomorphaceae bacterium]
MLHILVALLLWTGQDDRIQFQLTNTSSEPLKIEIPGFRTIILGRDQFSDVSFHPGQEVYLLKDLDGDDEEDRILLLVVAQDHLGAVIKVDKRLKKVKKEYLSGR